MTNIQLYIIVFISALLLASCSGTKCLPGDETLYIGSTVRIKDPSNSPTRIRSVLKTDLQGAVRPRPNTTFLGVRLKLGLYGVAGCDSTVGRGIRGFIRRFAEPPVPASSFDTAKNIKLLVNILQNRGFFYPTVTANVRTRKRKTLGRFDVTTGPMYTIRNVEFVQDSSKLTKDIALQKDKTLLKKGAPYNLDLIKGERTRLDKELKEIGYYYFLPDHIIVQADTSVGDHKVDLYVKPKDDMPEEAREVYSINNVFIYPNANLRSINPNFRDSVKVARRIKKDDTIFYKRYYIIDNRNKYEPFLFTQAMQFYPGDLYNRTDQNMAMNRLVNMGVFKFVRNEFDPLEDNLLDVYYYLTPYPKKAIRVELGGYSKSDSRTGSNISLSWRNRNTFKGAELLTLKAVAGSEIQRGGQGLNANAYNFGFEPSLTIPRFVIPFWQPKSSSFFVPHTVIRLRYDAVTRPNLYLLNSFEASYGFQWKENIHSEHQLFPIRATYVFVDTLNKDTTLFINYNNLLFNGLIIGPTYNYTYNTRVTGQPHINDYYFNGLVDLSGNILGGAQGSSLNKPPKEIFGAVYAQYVKTQVDFRYYRNYDSKPTSIWANRIIIGFGYPYGNSFSLPNIKQFFAGGNSSLRGFRSRLVGPGTFHEDPDHQTLVETSGDIKLELNTEVRHQLYSFIHGALFIDAGNVWTYRPDPIYNYKGAFTSKFLSELAVDVGVGLRFDFQILAIRLDMGIPVRKPWLTEKNPWDFSFNMSDSKWRGQNMVFNFAIGYPF